MFFLYQPTLTCRVLQDFLFGFAWLCISIPTHTHHGCEQWTCIIGEYLKTWSYLWLKWFCCKFEIYFSFSDIWKQGYLEDFGHFKWCVIYANIVFHPKWNFSSSWEALKSNPTFDILEEITNSIMHNIIFLMYHRPIMRNNLLNRFCIQSFCQKLHHTSKVNSMGEFSD